MAITAVGPNSNKAFSQKLYAFICCASCTNANGQWLFKREGNIEKRAAVFVPSPLEGEAKPFGAELQVNVAIRPKSPILQATTGHILF